MKYIRKNPEPGAFTRWKSVKRRLKNPMWQKLTNPTKNIVRNALIDEQGHICCYCGIRIDSKNHIDHIMPRSIHKSKMFDWNNLLVSCQRDPRPPEPKHCGWARKNKPLKISPLDPDCENRFRYLANGRILPASSGSKADEMAQEVIDDLNLDNEKLKILREGAINGVLAGIENLNESQLINLIAGYKQKDSNGRYSEFCMAVIYILNFYIS